MQWDMKWRKETWEALNQEWDIIVIGGGITGAGILREAANAGLKTLLVEAYDFAFGTSSRSSKLIHGFLLAFEFYLCLESRSGLHQTMARLR